MTTCVPSNSRIIYVALTGYGMDGPERDRSGFDYAAFWARSGIMGTLGEHDEPPVQQRPGMGDQTTSLAMTAAIGMALFERERSGEGQRVDCALLHTGLWVIGADVVAALRDRQPAQRNRREQSANPLFNFYEARDGKWVQLVMIESDRFWQGFCRAMEIDGACRRPPLQRPLPAHRQQRRADSPAERALPDSREGGVGRAPGR